MQELRTGLWHWESPYPGWEPSDGGPEGWGPDVSSYAIDDGERLLLIDPLAPPDAIAELAAGRATAILLTCPWHARDARALVERLGASLFAPPPDEADPDPLPAQVFRAGEEPVAGVKAFPGMEPNDLVLWVESRGALFAGDTLIDRADGNGLVFPSTWADKGVPADEILETLRPLLELPVELVLPTHGAPTDRAALERALA
jgi:glyoxylase-like metal-dependent hydrolase (beta-lactamase superfamily II)